MHQPFIEEGSNSNTVIIQSRQNTQFIFFSTYDSVLMIAMGAKYLYYTAESVTDQKIYDLIYD